jgi:predicted membrane channel-forming protein YqfA (hemolysin III family)
MQPYQPISVGSSVIAIIFYLIMAAFVLYSLIALYSLLRFGRTKILAIIVSILYLIISAGLYAAAVSNLNAIKF